MKKTVLCCLAAAMVMVLAAGCVSVRAGKEVPAQKYMGGVRKPGWITRVTVGEGARIGNFAFWHNRITRVSVGEGAVIGGSAFEENRVKKLVIPRGVSIWGDAFRNNRLTSLTLSEGVTIGKRAFAGNQLTSLTLPEGITSIEDKVFSGNQLTSLVIPESVTTIGAVAFANNQLTSLTIPKGVTIGKEAFAHNQLTSITISEGVRIGEGAFRGNRLASIIFEGAVRDCSVNSFGGNNSEVGFAVMSGKVPGTYTRQGNTWLFNGAPLERVPRATLVMDTGVYAVRIDGLPPEKFVSEESWSVKAKEASYLVPPGMHSVEVRYESTTFSGRSTTTTKSEGSVTFEHRYLFEGATYLFTGTPIEDKIIFSIVKQ